MIGKETAVMEQSSHPGHVPGETSDSPQRPAQRVSGTVLTFELQDELARLRREPAWARGERNAITLIKEPDFRVVLTTLKAGARVQEHHVDARFTLQTVLGRLRLHLPQQTVDLAAGQLVALESGVTHDVEALEESAFLLTIAWPAGQKDE
jgi:quercetin dioxygenase-like cupin family protein